MASFPAILKQLGRRVKELRKGKGWSQEKLAKVADISRTYMGTIEVGTKQPTLWTLFRIAKALDVPVLEIFIPPTQDQRQGADIVARIHARLLEGGRTVQELQKVEDLVEAFLRKGR